MFELFLGRATLRHGHGEFRLVGRLPRLYRPFVSATMTRPTDTPSPAVPRAPSSMAVSRPR